MVYARGTASSGTIERGRSAEAAALLTELMSAHSELASCMADMDKVTREAAPDELSYTRARFRVSHASLTRRTLFWRISDFLQPRLSGHDAEVLDSLRWNDREMMGASAAHVSRWTNKAVGENWLGYCQSSREIRARMQQLVNSEIRDLYPLLQKYSQR